MYSLSTKVEYATDITLRGIVRLKRYRVQRKKNVTLFSKSFCGYSCFDILEHPEASRSGWN
jgi:hypothetical protein